MKKHPIDFAAFRSYWAGHMEPVADELRRRGHDVFWSHECERLPVDEGLVTVVASSSDMDRAIAAKRRVVLMEHGAGQSYSNRHKAHVGGTGRQKVALCLLPNDEALQRHQRYYPRLPGVMIGSPVVDVLIERFGLSRDSIRRDVTIRKPTIAVSWHFDSSVSTEARSAWGPIGEPILTELCDMRDLGWIELLGHAHPKAIDAIRPFYEERSIPVARNFDHVCAEADLYMIDNSSTMFEFAALDRPVIVVDSPKYRRSANHGLRFWWAADVGVRINNPGQVPRAVIEALIDPPPVAARRRQVIEAVYPHRGEAARKAADAIEALCRA